MEEQIQTEENPNRYSIKGKKYEFPSGWDSDMVVRGFKEKYGQDIGLPELLPLNPNHPKHAIPAEPSWGDRALEFSKGIARPIIATGLASGATALGAPAVGAAALGLGGAVAADLAIQSAQGKQDYGEALTNAAEDEIGGKVFKYAGKLLTKGGQALKQRMISPGLDLSLGQQVGDTMTGRFLQGTENLFAAKNKAALMSGQAQNAIKKFYNIIDVEDPSPSHLIANTIEDVIEKNHTNLTRFADATRNEIVKIGQGVEARIPSTDLSPLQQAEQFFSPGKFDKVVKQPIPLQGTLNWARKFLKESEGSIYLSDLRSEARQLIQQTENGKMPLGFDELYNKFFASDSVKKQLAREGSESGITKTAVRHFDDLRQSLRDDISNGIEQWQLPDNKKVAVQDAWIRARTAFDSFQDSYSGVDGLQKLITQNPGNKLGAVNGILQDPELLKRTVATGVLKLGDGKVISKDVKKDFGTLYLKNKLESAWDPVNNRFDGNALLKVFKEGTDTETQKVLFNAKQRSDLEHLTNTIGHIQMKGPAASQNLMLSKAGLMFRGGLAGTVLAGAMYGLGAEALAVEIGLGGFANLAVKNPTAARQIAEVLSGKPLGQSMLKYGNQLAGALNGVAGVVTMKNGTKVPGQWENGKFVPTEQ